MTQHFDDLESEVGSTLKRLFPPAEVDATQLAREARTTKPHHVRTLLLIAAITMVTALAVLLPVMLLHGSSSNRPTPGTTGSAPRWAHVCVSPLYGPVTHDFDGLSVPAARTNARHEGMTMDFLAADGRCDIGRTPILAGHVYVHAAIANGHVVFARMSEPRPSH